MVEFEIETGMMADGGSWGYIIHASAIERDGGRIASWEYCGEWFHGCGYESDEAARIGACEHLDNEYGKGAWAHV